MREYAARLFRECVQGDNSISRQIWRGWRPALGCFGAGLGALTVTYLIASTTGEPLSRLTRDPAAVTDSRLYIGFLSNAGVILWSAATAVWFFGALLGRRQAWAEWTRFLTATGALSLFLTLDDTYMLHEEFFPRYLHVHEYIVYAAHFVAFGAWTLPFSARILETDYLFLVLAFLFLGLSMSMDSLLPFGNRATFVEDGLKFTGIVFWVTYGFRTVGALASGKRHPHRNLRQGYPFRCAA
jgi:hypothetical protein